MKVDALRRSDIAKVFVGNDENMACMKAKNLWKAFCMRCLTKQWKSEPKFTLTCRDQLRY